MFAVSAALLIVQNRLQCGFAQFKLGAHFLDLRGLLFELRGEDFHSFLQLRDSPLLFLRFAFLFVRFAALLLRRAVLFEEFIEQHRVHRLVADSVDLAFSIARHQIGIHLFHILGY